MPWKDILLVLGGVIGVLIISAVILISVLQRIFKDDF